MTKATEAAAQVAEKAAQAPMPDPLAGVVQPLSIAGVDNLIAVVSAAFALFSVVAAICIYLHTSRRERRIEKSTAYLDLEVHSSEAFRYQAEHARLLAPLRLDERPNDLLILEDDAKEAALNYYFQCLNLFEVCSNFRRHNIISAGVFASWVAWFHDILKDWYFRSIWRSTLRNNYTRDVRNVFDIGVEIFETHRDPDLREREFYQAVAYLMNQCPVVANWLDDMQTAPIWPPTSAKRPLLGRLKPAYKALPMTIVPSDHERAPTSLALAWNAPDDVAPAAAFAARVIGASTDYISHGEIQTGLSSDGRTWSPELAELYASDFADLTDRDLLVARTPDGDIAAIAILAWEETPRRKFAVIEDMAVDPAIRSGGVGAQMIEALAARVRERGVGWVFLESGLRNERAHAFFQRHGFAEVSHVFARRLDV